MQYDILTGKQVEIINEKGSFIVRLPVITKPVD